MYINQLSQKSKKILLGNMDEVFLNPYISFHPNNLNIHINCLNKRFESDFPIMKRSNKDNLICFPFVQIIYPNGLMYLDEYKKNKYSNPLYIKEIENNKSLSIEIWIHPFFAYIDPKDLPLKNERGQIQSLRFNNSNLTKYTCSLFINEIDIEKNNKKLGNIIIHTHSGKIPFVFELIPNIISQP